MMTREIAELLPEGIVTAELYGTAVVTNIGVRHEDGHKEPWIIAMNVAPSEYKILDYGMRWGIEAMFSDFKTRGFGITQSQIRKRDRLARLMLVPAIAMYWAGSTGASEEQNVAQRGEKGDPKSPTIHMLALQSRTARHPKRPTPKSQNSGKSG